MKVQFCEEDEVIDYLQGIIYSGMSFKEVSGGKNWRGEVAYSSLAMGQKK